MLIKPSIFCQTRAYRQRGSSLLEILITVLIISFGLLALAGMQAFSVATTSSATNRAIAAAMASDYADLMRANAAGFAIGGYDRAVNFSPNDRTVTALTTGDTCVFPNCTASTLAEFEKKMTLVRLKAALPAGDFGLIRVVTAGVSSPRQADLWIMWTEQQLNTDVDAGGASKEKTFDNCPNAIRSQIPLPRCFYMRVSL